MCEGESEWVCEGRVSRCVRGSEWVCEGESEWVCEGEGE